MRTGMGIIIFVKINFDFQFVRAMQLSRNNGKLCDTHLAPDKFAGAKEEAPYPLVNCETSRRECRTSKFNDDYLQTPEFPYFYRKLSRC